MLSLEAIKNFSIDKSDWKQVKFGDVVFEPKESIRDPIAEGIEHVVGLEHIDKEDIHLRRSAGIEESTTFTKKFSKGDVLFGRRRAYLKKAAQASFEGICSGDITVMRAKKEFLLPGLLPFIINNDKFFDYAITHSAGGLSPRVKFKDLANNDLCLPPPKIQKKILDLLLALDDSTEKTKEVCDKLHITLKAFREKKLCSTKFNNVRLSTVLEGIVAGKSLNGDNIPVSRGEKGVLKISAVGAEGFVFKENKFLKNQDEFIQKYQVKKNDILMTRANTTELVGRTCLVDENYPDLMLSDKTLKLVFAEDKVDKLFITEVLNSISSRNQIESFATGTGSAMKNISQHEIGSIKISMPPFVEQQRLGKLVFDIRTSLKQQKAYSVSLYQLKNSIINQVF